MTQSSVLISVRVDSSVAALLPRIAEEYGLTEALAVEKLIIEEAESLSLLPKGSPTGALADLVEMVRRYLDGEPSLAHDQDVTRTVFDWIHTSPRCMKVYEAAITPPQGIRPEKRRQFVHQRVGRFIKDHLGLVSLEEVTLPRGSDALIRGYTRLGK